MLKPLFKKISVLIAIAISIPFFVGCIHLFQSKEENTLTRTPSGNYSSGEDYNSNPQDLSFAELKKILATHSFSKIEDLLEYLKDKKPKYMSRYTLAYNSKSLHGSSRTHPRAIVYGKSADLILTFNGSPDQKAYEMLEVMSFNKEVKTYDFFEIEFNEKNIPLKPGYKISDSGGPDHKCLACHVQSKPLWETYRHWPGMYGSGDDFPLFTGNSGVSMTAYVPGLEDRVTGEWEKFKQESLTQGRYRFLPPQAPSISDGPKSEPRPNLDLGLALFYRNMERITELLKKGLPPGPQVRSLILYSQFCFTVHKVPEALEKIRVEFEARANAKLLERSIYLVKEEIQNLGITWQDLQRGLQNPNLEYYRANAYNANNENDFYKQVAGQSSFSKQDQVDSHAFLLSIVEKFVPNAHVETWPMNLHRAYRFDNGRYLGDEFNAMVLNALYPDKKSGPDKNKIESLKDFLSKDFKRNCDDLLKDAGY